MYATSSRRGSQRVSIDSELSIFNDEISLLSDDLDHRTVTASFQTETKSTKMKSTSRKQTANKDTRNYEPVVNGGFSLGKRTSFKPSHSVWCSTGNENDIGEVYAMEMQDLATGTDGLAVSAGRQIIAPRINKIGYIAQNLSLDHVSVPQTTHPELRPDAVKMEVTEYIVNDDSPIQIDVKWSKPENADQFKSLAYQIDIKPEPSSNTWTTVGCVRFSVFRVYHTTDKLLLGKVHVSRQSYDLIYALRCRALGEMHENNVSCVVESEWSQNVTLVFRGYRIDQQPGVFFNF
ncbi:hypothetical protein BsWGS_22931 [Bradybaena similaris]